MSSTTPPTQINRTPILIILGLAVVMVLGVLFGSKYVFNQVARQPVAMPELPSPLADSPECASLIATLPAKVAGHPRAELADPAPAGAAAWQSSSTERVTLRCGVDMPLQYTVLSEVETVGGVEWLRVEDPASDMATWFTVDRSPVVAVTGSKNPAADLADAVAATLPAADIAPAPAPLSGLAAAGDAGGDSAGAAEACAAFASSAPESIAEGYTLAAASAAGPGALAPGTVAWTRPGHDPIVVRCGVTAPASYAPGAALTQVNDIPWFEETDPAVTQGGFASVYYALGRATDVAASFPVTGSNEIITNLSDFIAAAVPAQPAP